MNVGAVDGKNLLISSSSLSSVDDDDDIHITLLNSAISFK
jgi:hypothetical protein